MVRENTRRVERRDMGVTVTYTSTQHPGHGWHACRMLNLSELGVGLEIYDLPGDELGEGQIVVNFEILDRIGEPLRLSGSIRHTGPGPFGGVRVGIEFGPCDPLQRRLLENLLAYQAASS
jgi:hypothetical protein